MNRRDIEDALKISRELRNIGNINQELRNTRKIQNELSNYKNTLGKDELINLRNESKPLQNHRDEIRRLSDFQSSRGSLGISQNPKFNELLDSRRSLEKLLNPKDELIDRTLLNGRKNFIDDFGLNHLRQHQKETEQIKKDYSISKREIGLIKTDYLRSKNHIELIRKDLSRSNNEFSGIRKDYFDRLPKWQEQIIPALSIRHSEIQEFINDRKSLREKIDFIPNNFRKQEFWSEIDSLRNTYVGNLAVSMRDAIESSSSNEEIVEKIESLFEEKVGLLPQNQLSREFIISLFLTILFTTIQLWYSYYLSQQSSIELNSLFTETFQRLEKIENKLNNSDLSNEVSEDNEIYYLVQRNVSVYNRPDFKSLTIDYLSPKTKVRLLKTKHRWIYIEYIDYMEVVPRQGWVSKKYLKKTDN